MNVEVKDFDVGREKASTISFKIAGQTFRSKNILAPSILEAPEIDPEAMVWERSVEFIRRILIPEDRQAFLDLWHDPDAMITTAELGEIVVWLIEKASGRPLGSLVPSGDGGTPPSTGSKEKLRGRAKNGAK